MNSRNRFIILSLVLIEFVFLNVVLVVILAFRIPGVTFTDSAFYTSLAQLSLIYNMSWLLIILYIREKGFYFNPDYRYIKNFVLSLFFFVGFASTLVVILKIEYFSRITFILPIFVFCYINLFVHKYLLKYLKEKSAADLFSNVLLIGSGKDYSKLLEFKKNIIRQAL